jgi:hypothetical protein
MEKPFLDGVVVAYEEKKGGNRGEALALERVLFCHV